MKIQTSIPPIVRKTTPPKPENRDALGIRHDTVNDCLMLSGGVAFFGGMLLRTIDPRIGSLVSASAGLFLGAALLR